MIKKVSRRRFLKNYPNFPVTSPYRNKYFFPETYNSYILYAESRSAIGLCKNISASTTALMKGMGFQEMYFLGDTTSPWLFRDHDYKPVKQALEYLEQHKITRSFNGAIEVDERHLPVFLRHLFWLVRCNGVLFTPYFSDAGFNLMISMCQYGNIHVSTLNQQADESFNTSVFNTGLKFLNEERCGSYKIPHRVAANV
jgi:hypothetical protein